MSADLSIAGRLYQDGHLKKGVLHIDTETGLIEKVAKSGRLDDHRDFGDQAILPGAIDMHVHFRDPGATHKEDIQTGSTSAAFGGVTAFVDMPNTAPPTTTMKALREKLRLMRDKAVVDYAAWSGATWFLEDLPDMLRYTPGIKIYLGATTGDLLLDDGERVKEALRITGQAGKVAVLHCEAQRVLSQFRTTEKELADHDRTRPPLAEVEAIYDVMKALPSLDAAPRIHVAHIASREAVEAAKAAGFSRGACPHHLLLETSSCCSESPGHGKMNPPLRGPASRDALWAAFASGDIPLLESDHAPHTKTEKNDTFHQVPAGVPGVETMVPLLLAKATAGDVALATVVHAATAGPADLLGLKDRGALAAGMRADLAVYDLESPAPIETKALHSKCGWTPFEGMDAVFPSFVAIRGRAVVEDGKLRASPGDGRPLFDVPEDL